MIYNKTQCFILVYEPFSSVELSRHEVEIETALSFIPNDFIELSNDLRVRVVMREFDFKDVQNPMLYIRTNTPRIEKAKGYKYFKKAIKDL